MEKLTAPKLPKGYRFHVSDASDPRYLRVELEKKMFINWQRVAYYLSNKDASSIRKNMELLLNYLVPKDTQYHGYYPPREEL